MKIKVGRITKVICFLLVAAMMINMLNTLLKPKWLENEWQSAKTNLSFYDLEDDSIDVAFIGASVIAAGIDPHQLYEETGISSYNLGVMSQPMVGTYFWLKEAINNQHIKLAVIEVKSAGKGSEKEEAKARKSYDYMEEGLTKVQYAYEYYNSHREDANGMQAVDMYEYLFPLSIYHSRWSELSFDDFDFALGNNDSYTRGFAPLTYRFQNADNFEPTYEAKGKYDGFDIDTDKEYKGNTYNTKYLKRIIKLAKKEKVQLLFTKMPDSEWTEEKHNYINNIAKKSNIPFLDLNTKENRIAMNFDYSYDAADLVHVNMDGAKKITKYMGEYLKKNYKLTNNKDSGSSVDKAYKAERSNYEQTMTASRMIINKDVTSYLETVCTNDDYSVLIASGAKTNPVLSDAQMSSLEKIGYKPGFEKTASHKGEYGVDFICIKDQGKNFFRWDEQNEGHTKSLKKAGQFADGTDFSVSVSYKNNVIEIHGNPVTKFDETKMVVLVYDNKLNAVVDVANIYSEDGIAKISRED